VINRQIFISVIVPVRNASQYLDQCLAAITASSYFSYEIIVVDDCSTDDSTEIARKMGARVLALPRQSGPAAARNYGADEARGDILLFVDSDVVVQRETVARLVDDFIKNPDIAAVFGSYDDSPASPDFLSQFRNLFHHFIHQHSHKEAKTFWAGCGAIYREIFYKLQGFNQLRYPQPSIEDIELGLRMWKSGYLILMDKELQVKHLKHWGLLSWLKTDIFRRAVPWSQLILETGILPRDLNLQTSYRISALLVGLLVLLLPLALFHVLNFFDIALDGIFLVTFLLLIFVLITTNWNLYTFLYRRRGIKFMFFAIPLHFLYYFYSGVSFTVCWVFHKFPSLHSGLKKVQALTQKNGRN
jgi:glycosyltransferase involved in cell wall biosynthesis